MSTGRRSSKTTSVVLLRWKMAAPVALPNGTVKADPSRPFGNFVRRASRPTGPAPSAMTSRPGEAGCTACNERSLATSGGGAVDGAIAAGGAGGGALSTANVGEAAGVDG